MLKKSSFLKELIQNTVESVLDEHSILAITDATGNIIYANKKFCDLSKYSIEELLGNNHRILKSGYHDNSFYENMWDTISNGKTWHGDIKNKAKDGTFYWLKTTIMPIFNNSKKISHYIAIRTDITEIIEIREKLIKAERLSVIGELSAQLSHDMRNPLAIIENANDILRLKLEGKLDEESKKVLKYSDNAIRRLSHQIENVLDFVRSNPLKIQLSDINEIIYLGINTLNIPNKIKINVDNKSLEIQCDPFQLEIAFKNLIQNSIQAIEKGSIDINYVELQNEIIIEFVDSGPGIPEDIIGKIFDPLFTTKQKGTGLGLTSCKNIVEQHGGKIFVKNNPTTFTIILPKNIPSQFGYKINT
ncbi:MAG: PAS domain S-box protein [Thaumarchaeota archaeon]|nr:PAS domain S-box protein [Nitrososphaerota archaeon]